MSGMLAEAVRRMQAERLVTRLEEVGCVLGDLGLALIKTAKYEDEEGARSGAYTLSASASKAIAAEAKRVGTARCLPPSPARWCRCGRDQVCRGFACSLYNLL